MTSQEPRLRKRGSVRRASGSPSNSARHLPSPPLSDDVSSPTRRPVYARAPPSLRDSDYGKTSVPARHGGDEDESEHRFSGWHYIPLIFALVPPLGAVVHGRAEAWTDMLMLIVIAFCPCPGSSALLTSVDLYQVVRIPWELYYAARTRRIAESAPEDDELEGELSSEKRQLRRAAMSELRQHELFALALCVVAPLGGAYLLYGVRGVLSEPDRFINPLSVRLFVLASGIKPWTHLISLLRKRSLYLQETVHYPHGGVQRLRERTAKLETELAQLRRMFATKADVRLLRDGIDAPLTQLSKAVRRHERKEEYLRLSADERFALVDARLEDAMREVAIQADLLDALREDAGRSRRGALGPLAALLSLLHARKQTDPRARWYERGLLYFLFLPLNISNLALETAGDLGDSWSRRLEQKQQARLVENGDALEQPSRQGRRSNSTAASDATTPRIGSPIDLPPVTTEDFVSPPRNAVLARMAPALRVSPATPPNS